MMMLGNNGEEETMSKYTVETRDGARTCGHQHRTALAAERCRLRLCGDARYYGAEVRKNGQRTDGTGHWPDGESRATVVA
jgi:hypothetical protein